MKELVEDPAYLLSLKEQIDELIRSGATAIEKPEVYEALKLIIDQRITEGTFRARFEEINDFVISMAQMNFSKTLDFGAQKDLFTYVASSLNLLNEELGAKAVSKNFVQSVIERSNKSIILINKISQVKFINTNTTNLLDYKIEDLIDKNINTLLDGDLCFTFSECWGERTMETYVLNKLNSKVPVILTASPINNGHTIDGYILEFLLRN